VAKKMARRGIDRGIDNKRCSPRRRLLAIERDPALPPATA